MAVERESFFDTVFKILIGALLCLFVTLVLIILGCCIGDLINRAAHSDAQNLENYRFWVNDGDAVKGLGDYSIVTDQETGIQYLMVGDDISPLYDKDGKPMQVTE